MLINKASEIPSPRSALLDHFRFYSSGGIDPRTVTALPPASAFAHLIIDVQRKFCDPTYSEAIYATEETQAVARRIASVMPAFRAAGAHTFISYYGRHHMRELDHTTEMGGLYAIEATPADECVKKGFDDAFKGSDIHARLQARGIKILLVSGFNANACVKDTVKTALKMDYSVGILTDCIGQGDKHAFMKDHLEDMARKGAVPMTSTEALEMLALEAA